MATTLAQVNWLAVVVAAVAALVVGFVWYLPPLFGTRWASLVKTYGRPFAENPRLDPMRPANPLMPMGVWLIGFVVNALVLSLAIKLLGIGSVGSATGLALLVWLAFAATLSSWPAAFARWPWGLWLINNGAYLVMQIVMAVILTLWK
jgi:hypothetical protein